MRVAKRAQEVDAGPRALPGTPLAALAPGLATGEAPDIAGAMRDWVRLQTAVLEKEKKANKLSFNLQARACAAPGCGRNRPAMWRWAASGARAGASAEGRARRFPGRRIAFRSCHGALRGATAKRSLRCRARSGVLVQALAKAARERGRPWIGSPDGEDLQLNFKPPWRAPRARAAARAGSARGAL